MESTPQASPPSDADLLQAYRNGDARAFERLLRRYERPLFTFIVRLVADRDEAEDVYQDTLSRVVEKIQSYDERGKFGSWLFGIAHHLCVDRSRRKARWKFIFSDEV
ncbi:MAG: sigma-70 family RNA polymerase sigma factor, partial [Bacteroidota bacterium]